MKFFRLLADILLFNAVFVSFCALALCMATERELTMRTPAIITPLHTVIAGASLVVYNLHHVVRMLKNRESRLTASLTNKISRPLFSLWGLALIFTGIVGFPPVAAVLCLVMGIVSLSYSIPLLPGRNQKRLRDFGWFKILSLTSIWTLVTTVLPALYHQQYNAALLLGILPRFTFMFALCLLFDIRDVRTDVANHITTLPARLGLHRSYRMVYVLLAIWMLLGLLNFLILGYTPAFMATIITWACCLPVIYYLKRSRSTRAYLFLGDGMMLLYGLLAIWL